MRSLDFDRVDEDGVLVALALTALSFLAFAVVLLAGWGREFLTPSERTKRP